MLGKPWTYDECETLRRMLKDGHDFNAVSRALGRSYRSVTSWAAAHDVRRRNFEKWTAREVTRARELYECGYTCAEIAKRMGRTEQSVYTQLRRVGVTKRSRSGWYRVDREAMRYTIAREGWSGAEAVAILGLTMKPRSLMAWTKDYAERAGLPPVAWPRGPRPFRDEAVSARRDEIERTRRY